MNRYVVRINFCCEESRRATAVAAGLGGSSVAPAINTPLRYGHFRV